MANMSYCRFENTFHDLDDCYDHMVNDEDDLSETEEKYRDKLIDLCSDIASNFGKN